MQLKLLRQVRHGLVAVLFFGLVSATRANLVFNLIPQAGTSQQAIDGFTAAGKLWSDQIADNITVNIQIGFTDFSDPRIIGSSGSDFREYAYSDVVGALMAHRTSADDVSAYAALQPGDSYSRLINHTSNNPNGLNSATPYLDTMNRVGMTTVNAKALGLLAPSSSLDAVIQFNSLYAFDFNHGSTITPGMMDFVGAAAHEIGHSLGFVSGVDDIDTLAGAYSGDTFSSNLLDLFRYSTRSLSFGPGITDYTADDFPKYFSVDGGTNAIAAFANGITYGDGDQASHWKNNAGVGIMNPTLNYGDTMNISTNDLRAMDVLGYQLVPEPGPVLLIGVFAGVGFLIRRGSRQPARNSR
ncbi:MAG: NF038122 family metalloprotease [Verrucomicrobiota bacterium]